MDCYVQDYVEARPGLSLDERSDDDHEMTPLRSEPVVFRVRKANQACCTLGALQRTSH